MSQAFRLPEGGQIDRSELLDFTFNGKPLQGHPGDTLASALLANGVRTVARSFKYHRPRGIMTAGEEEPTGLVEVGEGAARIPTCRAPCVPLVANLSARSQSGWPGLAFDVGRVLDFTHALWPAGFYNKTFKWPAWSVWEPMVRRLAGRGRPLRLPDPDHYEQVNAHCDLLICGGGPAGLMAALVAGRAGARVILAEQDAQLGGCLNAERVSFAERSAADWLTEIVGELTALPRVMLLPATTASGIYDGNITTLLQRGTASSWRACLWTVRPRQILLATGAIEQAMIFPDNDRPGVMLAGAVRHYLNRYAVAPGRSVVVTANNDSAYQTALDLAARDIPVAALIDQRTEIRPALRHLLQDRSIPLLSGSRIIGTRGFRALREVRVESASDLSQRRLRCDLLAVSGGWSPRLHLYCHARGQLRFDGSSQCFLPDTDPPGVSVTGGANGVWSLEETLARAESAARELCDGLGLRTHHAFRPTPATAPIEPGETAAPDLRTRRRRQWIDLAHDVTLADAELAVREGFVSVEHFKRYTTSGMSVDQGKTGNLNAFAVLAQLTGRPIWEIGTTTFRPPYRPMALGALAGRREGDFYAPRRLLPAQQVHESLGAIFEDYGGWQRPEHYTVGAADRPGCIEREVLAVRRRVGVFDNSPIGKIEVHGPDAAEFLQRVYVNQVHGLATGRCRYGLMLNENGVVIDDGVFSRLNEDHFLINTTSGGVNRIFAMLDEWRQCEWPDLKVLITDVTAQWANFTVAGPRARDLLKRMEFDIDLDARALPHMALATRRWDGEPMRVLRVSFSGEMSFEINVPAGRAKDLLDLLVNAGQAFELRPYGIEALMILRLEKGYLHVGSDTDGTTTPDDIGWGRVARAGDADYIGRRSLYRPSGSDPDRRQLVGIGLPANARVVPPGSHLLLGENRQPPADTDGWVTSSAWSPTLERPVALAMLRTGSQRLGAAVTIIDGEHRCTGRIVAPCRYDPGNERLRT